MKLKDYICFKPPTLYDIFFTICMMIMLCGLWKISASQNAIQKDYVTKEYMYYFYITKDMYQAIEKERPKYLKRISNGEDATKVYTEYGEFVERILTMRTRGG